MNLLDVLNIQGGRDDGLDQASSQSSRHGDDRVERVEEECGERGEEHVGHGDDGHLPVLHYDEQPAKPPPLSPSSPQIFITTSRTL